MCWKGTQMCACMIVESGEKLFNKSNLFLIEKKILEMQFYLHIIATSKNIKKPIDQRNKFAICFGNCLYSATKKNKEKWP